MRLQQSIFLWIAVSAILPLTLVILALTVYGERLYRQQVTQEINASLGNVITDIERNLAYERSILLRIVSSSAVQKYLPVLDVARDGEMHPDFNAKTDRLNRFLLSFNDILLGQGTFRVLDLKGNTLVKVGFGRITPASFDGFESFPFAEQEHVDISGALKAQMDEIKSSEVNFLSLLPDNRDKPMLDGVVPLIYRGERVGYLVSSLIGLQLDYILQLAPRPYQGKLSVIEVVPDMPARHGRLLYDDSRSVFFSDDADDWDGQFGNIELHSKLKRNWDCLYPKLRAEGFCVWESSDEYSRIYTHKYNLDWSGDWEPWFKSTLYRFGICENV